MNRRDRENRKKQKRGERQRAARSPRPQSSKEAPESVALPGSGLLPRNIIAALSGGKTERAIVDAAGHAAEATDGAVAVGWSQTDLVAECRRGCSYCCNVQVAVTVPEVARAIAYARAHLSGDELVQIARRAEENAAQTHGKTALFYPLRLPCAFLGDEGECRVYEARPLMCRREHSLDVQQCKDGFDTTTLGQDFPVDHVPDVFDLSLMSIFVYQQTLSQLGVDASRYELQEALHIALANPNAVEDWLTDDSVFKSASLNESTDEGEITPRLVDLRVR